ncbi:MAG: hypothetical protein CVV24_13420, partial [Ignavibacteriae bacterium HGW-Ignavibacteriae-3]
MNNENKFRQPLVIIAFTIITLFAVSFIKVDYEIPQLNFKLKNVDLVSDIKVDPPVEPISSMNSRHRVTKASFGFTNIFSSHNSLLEPEIEHSDSYSVPVYQGKKTPVTGNVKQLSYFFDALKNSKSKTVRIAHYGDSAIEGDLITADLRESFQSKFGGNGVGWLGITSQDITFRQTTKHSFSDNWES